MTEKLTEQDIEYPITLEDLGRLRAENERLAANLKESRAISEARLNTLDAHYRGEVELQAQLNNCECECDSLHEKLTAATERAERAERERDELLSECRSWRNEIIGERASYDLRLEAVIEKFDGEQP